MKRLQFRAIPEILKWDLAMSLSSADGAIKYYQVLSHDGSMGRDSLTQKYTNMQVIIPVPLILCVWFASLFEDATAVSP